MSLERPRIIEGGYTALTAAGITADLISHYQPKDELTQIFPYRHMLPSLISEHDGNFGLTALPIILAGIIGGRLEERGRLENNNRMERIGHLMPYIAVAGMVATNVVIESQFLIKYSLLRENMGDLLVGVIAVISGAVVSEMTNRYLHKLTGI